jgi:hypothetical protein
MQEINCLLRVKIYQEWHRCMCSKFQLQSTHEPVSGNETPDQDPLYRAQTKRNKSQVETNFTGTTEDNINS